MIRLFAEAVEPIEALRAKRQTLHAQATAIREAAKERDLNAEETTQVAEIFAAFEQTSIELENRLKLERLDQAMQAANPRRTEPPPAAGSPVATAPVPPPGVAAPAPTRAPITGEQVSARFGDNGFHSMGDFAHAVKAAAVRGTLDPRLRPLGAAGAPSQEGTGGDGGYLVPPDFRTVIMEKVQGEGALLGMTDEQTTTSNSITMPVDETTPWQTSGGLQVYWEGEGGTFSQSKVALRSVTVRANKIVALVPVTDELLEDAPSLNAYMSRKVPDKLTYKINDALINGDGVGKPLGILNSPALVTQAAEGAQTSGTINFSNIVKMWSRMYAPLRRNAVWLINQDVEPQLYSTTIPAASGVSAPAFIPPAGLPNAPNGTLLGRPIMYSEATQAVGTPGDILFVDFTQYLSLFKSTGLRADTSIHLWFDQGLVAFRFTMRLGGVPWWSSSITRAKSSNPLSFAVALASR